MPHRLEVTRRLLLQTAIAAPLVARAGAQEDTAPVKVVIAFPPGGTSTASMQPLQGPLGAALKTKVELEYKPGAGGNVAALHVAQAPADGRTLLFGHAGPLCINHHINTRSFFDAEKDFAPLAQVVRFPLVICAASRLGVGDLAGLISMAGQREMVVGSSGNGSIQHLGGELFRRKYNARFLHVPFAGGGPLQEALVRGDLELMFETGSNVVSHVRSGRLKALAVMGEERLKVLPETQTLRELGVSDLDVSAWFGLLAPAGTAQDRRDAVAGATLAALASGEIRDALERVGGVAAPLGQTDFAAWIAQENIRWRDLVKSAGIRPD